MEALDGTLEAVEALDGALEDIFRVFDAYRTQLRMAQGLVRSGTAGLLTSVEYSKIRDNTWHVHYPIVTNHTGVELVE